MNKREKKHPGLDRGQRHGLQTWGSYLLALLVWVTVVVLLAWVCTLVCKSIIWEYTPLYRFLNLVQDQLLFVCMAAILAGWVVISYRFVAGPIRQLEELTRAAQRLAHPTEEPIVLPPAMQGVEDQLNLVREQALRDAQAAREAEQRKNDLVVYLAHDLKTPLTSVIGYLTLLRDEPEISPALRARYTGVALEKAERLEELMGEFFDITRFSLSRLELERRPTDLCRMAEQVVSEFAPILAEKQLRCDLELPPKLPCSCDPDKLARVFDNLLRNACHYSFPETKILISGREEGDRVVLTFTNQGPTIPPEKLERIFERFFRLDDARSTASGGAGLGLAIAREIVELHGGSITAQSAGQKIQFTVSLPLGLTP